MTTTYLQIIEINIMGGTTSICRQIKHKYVSIGGSDISLAWRVAIIVAIDRESKRKFCNLIIRVFVGCMFQYSMSSEKNQRRPHTSMPWY